MIELLFKTIAEILTNVFMVGYNRNKTRSSLISPRLTLKNIEDKDINKLMSIELFKYNIDKHLNGVRNITDADKFRVSQSLQILYTEAYTTLYKTGYNTVKYNTVYIICEDILNILTNVKTYKSYNGITIEGLNRAVKSLKDRYNKVRYDTAVSVDKNSSDIFSIIPYMNLSPEVKELVKNIQTTSEILDNTISKSLTHQTISLIKLYKNYEDIDSRTEIKRQLTLISNFLTEQIEINALPGSKKHLTNTLGISSNYIQSVIDNNNWVE